MVYSCAICAKAAKTLEEAQEEKLETVARKLELKEGERVLDVGCGWGGFPLWAATKHGAERRRHHPLPAAGREGAAAGRGGRGRRPGRDPRHGLPRPAAGESFDAIASIGMVEHVGAAQIDVYAQTLAGMLEPGGRLLNHGITRLRHTDAEAGAFSERYVFPDAAPLHLSRNLLALERAGFVTRHVEDFGADYAETLRHWASNLDDNLEEATRLAGPERIRVWRLYLRAARNGFENGFTVDLPSPLQLALKRCVSLATQDVECTDRSGREAGLTSSIAQSAPASLVPRRCSCRWRRRRPGCRRRGRL